MSNASGKKRKGENTYWDGLKRGERQEIIAKSETSYFLARKILSIKNPGEADTDAATIEKVVAAYTSVVNSRRVPKINIEELQKLSA